MPLPLLPTQELDLARFDRQSILARLQTLAYQAIPNWSDFSPNYPENMILEAQAMIAGMMGSVVNERARQLCLALVTDRLAMIRQALPYGYSLSGPTAAQVDGTFYLPNSAVATRQVTLPAGFRIRSGDAQYQSMAAVTIDVGNNASATVTAENAETQEETYTSTEEANLVIQLAMDDVIEDSVDDTGHIYVLAGDGQYKDRLLDDDPPLRSFSEAGPDDQVFIPRRDNNGRMYLYFGNSIHGRVATGTITVQYKTGGGEAGRVSANADWLVQDTAYDDVGNAVTVLFQNPAISVGGYDATTVEEARVRAPLSRRIISACVQEEHYEYAAMLTAGIARAAMIGSNQDTSVPEDEGYLYLVAYGSPYSDSGYYPPASPTAAQISSVEAAINASTGTHKQHMGVRVTVRAVSFYDISVKVKIYKESGYTAVQVKSNITESLQKFFAVADDERGLNSNVDFGYKLLDADGDADHKIAWSKVLNAVNDTAGVREVSYVADNLLLNEVRQSVVIGAAQWPRFLSVTVYDMDQGGVAI